jgi:Tol biopolymer transport system component
MCPYNERRLKSVQVIAYFGKMRVKILLWVWLIVVAIIFSCNKKAEEAQRVSPSGAFFGLEPSDKPELLLPGFIATRFGEYNGCFNREGTQFYYTVSLPGFDAIVETHMLEDGNWTEPEIAPFSGKYAEYDPLIAPDGKSLLFSSQRPLEGEEERDRSGIWVMKKDATGSWNDPSPITLTGRGDYYSSMTSDGTIYFNVWYDGNIYKATPSDTGYVVSMPKDSLNSQHGDGDPFIAPDERYIIFRSYRPGGPGNGDLFISYNRATHWSNPVALPEPINSPAREMCPYVTPDGRYFIFASDRQTPYSEAGISTLKAASEKYNSYDNGNQNIYIMAAEAIFNNSP